MSDETKDNAAQLEAQVAGFARLARLGEHRSVTDHERRLQDRMDERAEIERDGVLSVEVERTVVIVLCTGGPHCEIRWTEDRTPTVVCYGWFGKGRVERELTDDEAMGVEYALGDWETLAMVTE